GRAAQRTRQGGLHLAARRVQVQHQPLSDPELLPGEGGKARRWQVPDRDRAEGVRELRRSARQGLRNEVRLGRGHGSPPLSAGYCVSVASPAWGGGIGGHMWHGIPI